MNTTVVSSGRHDLQLSQVHLVCVGVGRVFECLTGGIERPQEGVIFR